MPNPPSFMIHALRSRMHRSLLCLAAALLLLTGTGMACSLSGRSTPTATPPASPTNAGAGSVNDPAAGLEELSSYRATLHLEFDGTRDGAPLAWSQDLRLETDRAASARFLTIDRHGTDAAGQDTGQGTGQDTEGTLIGQFGPMTLTRPSAEGACSAITGETPPAIPEPASLLRPIQQPFSYAEQPEERNGVSTLHAPLDTRAVGASPQARVKGEVWVARQGEYIVSYVLEIDGTPDDWGKGVQGVMRWEYNLEDVGQDLKLLPPPGCPPGMVDAPLPEDAAQVESQPGMLTLTTGLDVTSAAGFYLERLPPLGWVESGTGFQTPRVARLTFVKPGRQLVISIHAGPPTQVWITLENPAAAAPGAAAGTATPAASNPAESAMKRVLISLNILRSVGAGSPAFPSYHVEFNHTTPVWAGGKVAQEQELLSADVQGQDVHFTDRKTAPGKPAKTAEAYVINGSEYVVRNGAVTPGDGLTSLAWSLWPADAMIVISMGSQATTPAGSEMLDGRAAEVYHLEGSGAATGGAGALLGLPITTVHGTVWVDQQTGALLKALLDYETDVVDNSGVTRGSGPGHLEIVVTQVGGVTVALPGK